MTVQQEIQALVTRLSRTIDEQAQAEIIVNILNKYARIHSLKGGPYADRLIQLADAIDSDRYRAHAIYHRALEARFGGDYMTALELSEKAYALFSKEKDQSGMANCHNNIGNIHQSLGNYAEALKNHLHSLKIRESTGDKNGIAVSYTNIAIIYYSQGSYEDALKNNLLALGMMQEIGNKQGIANAYTNIGNVYYIQGQHEEAMKNYLKCQQIQEETGNENGIAIAHANIGGIYRNLGKYEEALNNYQPALQRFGELGNKQAHALQLNNIGDVYFAKGDYQQALSTFISSLHISEEIGAKEETRGACEGLSTTYRALGDHENALKYFEKFHRLDKEMLGEEAQRQLINLNFQHDMELKEKESQLLKEKNEAISVYAQKLEVSNNELKQFAHVASHDLREPLRMVSSYMQLLEQTMGDQIQPVQKQFIGFAVDGAKRMENLIHELLHLAKVDADPKIEQVSLPAVVDEVKSNLEILLREKNAQIIASPLPAIMADRTQVMQLFQNIISNGIKYNESPSPTITIHCEQRENDALLSIADNGIGIPAEYRERAFQIFQRVPTAKQYQGSGIGLAICKKIVDGLGGSIAIDDHEGGGTVFNITVPLSLITVS